MSKADKLERVQPCSFICHIYVLLVVLMLVYRAVQVFSKWMSQP